MKNIVKCTLMAAFVVLFAGQAFANPCPPGNPPTNCAPPTGAILDLDGMLIPHSYTLFSVDFMATDTTTNISFAFREDPAFLHLDDVSVTTGGGPNLLLNPGFELGPDGTGQPPFWSYLNEFGVGAAGIVQCGFGSHSGNCEYFDGAIQGYDGITQGIATTIGSIYHISFWLWDDGPYTHFSRLSTNGDETGIGGNGVDLLVYAGAVPTIEPVPEPATLTLMGLGLVGLARARRRNG